MPNEGCVAGGIDSVRSTPQDDELPTGVPRMLEVMQQPHLSPFTLPLTLPLTLTLTLTLPLTLTSSPNPNQTPVGRIA